MPEYIEREAAFAALCEYCDGGACKDSGNNECAEYRKIRLIPAADVEAVRRGEWVCVNDTENVWMCDGADGCGGEIILLEGTPLDNEWERCPYCGARMDGKGDTDEKS